ncbi:MAG: hypothetical protein K0S32_4358 [Bacteroidetes bacterium]|jgi:hypothetical protein|nr:hypothetical protein [Bacteroidota bacterium]
MKIKNILFFLILSLGSNLIFSQITGGGHPNQSLPSEAKPSEISKGGFSSDVSLFTGALSSGYDLGSVKTLSGLSFNLRLNYNGTKVVGNNVSLSSGIPYGEGWSLNLPSISVSTRAYRNYTQAQVESVFNSYTTLSPSNIAYNKKQAKVEGELYYMAPYISIPGVVSERFILKNYDVEKDEAIFVPNKFEKLVEARLKGSTWYVTLENGDTYKFQVVTTSYRNPSGFKINTDSLRKDSIAFRSSILPKEEVLTWHCNYIYNKNHAQHQQIMFSYEGYGIFDFFKELNQKKMNPYYSEATSFGLLSFPPFYVMKDILLKSVSSSSDFGDIEKLELNYKTFKPSSHKDLLLPGDADVYRKDSMYNYKVAYTTAWDTTKQKLLNTVGDGTVPLTYNPSSNYFSSWRRYYHVYHNNISRVWSGAGSGGRDQNFANSMNPYLVNNSSNTNYYNFAGVSTSTNAAFDHCFLESPQISLYNINYVPGELYEIKTLIHNTNTDTAEAAHLACNYDISIVSGSGTESVPNNKLGENDYVNGARGFSIFNTFQNPVKWTSMGKNNDGSPGFTTPDPAYITTSNLFVMPKLPTNNNGVYFQVGPANSDHEVNIQMEDMGTNNPYLTGVFANNSYRAYSYWFYKGGANTVEKYKSTNPYYKPGNNFGLGLPWYMMSSVFSRRFGLNPDTNHTAYGSPLNRIWFKTDGLSASWSNVPTAANNNVKLTALELIRYSKNTYMLTNVKKYVTNGYPVYDKNNGYVLLDSITLSYQNIIDTVYDVTKFESFTATVNVPNDTTLNCTPYTGGSSFTKIGTKKFIKNGYQNVIILKSITSHPTNAVARNATFSSGPAALTTYFDYKTVKTDSLFFNDPYGVMQGQFSGHFHLLNKITDHLGGITEYNYYPINSLNSSWDNLYAFDHYKAYTNYDYYNIGRPVAYNATPMVKEKILYNSASDSLTTKVWQYIYDTCKYIVKKTPTLPDQYIKEKSESEYGFKRTTVRYPKLRYNDTKVPYDVYTHYTSESGDLLIGKLNKVESFDANGVILKKKAYTYEADTAYINWFYTRKEFTYVYDLPPDQSAFLTDYLSSIPSQNTYPDVPLISFSGMKMRFLENFKPNLFKDDSCQIKHYNHSYFIKLTKETNTDYDYVVKPKKSNPLPGPKKGVLPMPPSSNERTIASNANMTPVITSGYGSTKGNYGTPESPFTVISSTYTAKDSIENVSEYSYWEADHLGKTTVQGFKILMDHPANAFANKIKYEPSWQLYKKKSYSVAHPLAYTTEEYFYYYDVIQNYKANGGYYMAAPDSFQALYLSQLYRIRNIPYQKRTSLKNVNKPLYVNSDYYWYDAASKRWQCDLSTKTITINKQPCEYYGNGLDSADASMPDTSATTNWVDGCYGPSIRCERIGFSPIGGYKLFVPEVPGDDDDGGTGNPDPYAGWFQCTTECDGYVVHWRCPPTGTGSNSTGKYILMCGEKNLLKLKNVYHQKDSISTNTDIYTYRFTGDTIIELNYTNNYTQPFGGNIARFTYTTFINIPTMPVFQQTQNTYLFALPYKTYTPVTNLNFNVLGLLTKTRDQRGLIKEMTYDTPHNFLVKNTACSTWTWKTGSYFAHRYGQPSKVRIYDPNEEYTNEIAYTYKYNADLSIDSLKDNNNKIIKYNYDPFGRLTTTLVNNDTISISKYSYWNGSTASFETKAGQNYVETSVFNDKSKGNVETSRAYVDPLGRKFDVAVYADPDFYDTVIDDTTMIHSGTTTYDNWDRALKQYKPFIYRNSTPNTYVSFVPRFSNTSGPYSEQHYEPSQRGNVLAASKFGENITTGKRVLSNYNIIDGKSMALETSNTLLQEVTQTPNQTDWTYYKFLKTAVMDEDGKKTVTYTDALGKKVAVKTYADPFSSQLTGYIYGALFKPIEIWNPKNQKTYYKYDYNGNVIHSVSVDADTVKYVTEAWGDVLQSQSASQRHHANGPMRTEYTLDAFGKVRKELTLNTGYTEFDVIEHWIGTSSPTTVRGFGAKAQTYFTKPWNALNNIIGRVSMSLRNTNGLENNTTPVTYNAPYSANFYSYNNKGQIEREIVAVTALNDDFSVIHYTKYNLRNSLLEQQIDVNGDSIIDKTINYSYDTYNRLINVAVNNTLTVSYEYYDELGLIKKIKHYGVVQTGTAPHTSTTVAAINDVTYYYDTRNRLTRINSSLYDEKLYYDNNHPQITGTVADTAFLVSASNNFNGNINAIKHNYYDPCLGTGFAIMDSSTIYGYSYDGINRLTKADASIKKVLSNPGTYSAKRQCGDEAYAMDNIGNFLTTSVGRFTTSSLSNYTTQFNYNYYSNKNQLQFIDSAGVHKNDYLYNTSGSQRSDKVSGFYKRTSYIPTTYQLASKDFVPTGTISGGDTVTEHLTYYYNARNERILVNKQIQQGGGFTVGTKTYYLRDIGGKELASVSGISTSFANSNLPNRWIHNIYGREMITTQDSLNNHFYLTDHLGSVRVKYQSTFTPGSCGSNINIVEATDYSPYGKVLRQYQSGSGYKYGYQGSEKDDVLGLNKYYTHFRGLDGDIGRWKQVDPVFHDNENSYLSMGGNPIKNNDILGNDWFVNSKTGRLIYVKDAQELTQDVFDKAKTVGRATDYDRLGADDYFGKKILDAYGNNMLNNKIMFVENSEAFAEKQGFKKAEFVRVFESEQISGGRMGEENVTHKDYELRQIGNSRATYVKSNKLNTKEILKEEAGNFRYSSYRQILYNLTKPYGQDNKVTAEYYGNRQATDTGKDASFISNLYKLIKNIIKGKK